MRKAEELPPDELVEIVRSIQEEAFLDVNRVGVFWNPDKPLGADFIGDVCNLLARHGLSPETEKRTHE